MPNSPSFILGRRLEPTQPYKPTIQPILRGTPFDDHLNLHVHNTSIPRSSRPRSRSSISVVPSPRITKFAATGSSNSASFKRRPSTARTYAQTMKQLQKQNANKHSAMSRSLSVSYGLHTEFFSVFNPINLDEKPRWLNSARSGTIYEDHRTTLNREHEAKQKLKPKILSALQDCYSEIEHEEIRKHETRMRILYRFRLRRLENSLKSQQIHILQHKPIIFTPELGDHINPFNPSVAEVEAHTTNQSHRIEQLARPRLRYQVQTPHFVDLNEPEVQKLMHSIGNLKNIRNQYHWRSFVHRAHGHQDEMDDTQSQDTLDTVDTVSTCSHLSTSRFARDMFPIHDNNTYTQHKQQQQQQQQPQTVDTEKQRKVKEKMKKECLEEIKQFENKLNYLQRKNKQKAKKAARTEE